MTYYQTKFDKHMEYTVGSPQLSNTIEPKNSAVK